MFELRKIPIQINVYFDFEHPTTIRTNISAKETMTETEILNRIKNRLGVRLMQSKIPIIEKHTTIKNKAECPLSDDSKLKGKCHKCYFKNTCNESIYI